MVRHVYDVFNWQQVTEWPWALRQYNVDSPFERISLDISGPYQESKNGNRYILVEIENFRKAYVEVYAIPNHEVATVADCFRVPLEHPDQGLNFESEILRNRCEKLKIRKTRTALQPQSDRMVERMNQTIMKYLWKIVSSIGTNTFRSSWYLSISRQGIDRTNASTGAVWKRDEAALWLWIRLCNERRRSSRSLRFRVQQTNERHLSEGVVAHPNCQRSHEWTVWRSGWRRTLRCWLYSPHRIWIHVLRCKESVTKCFYLYLSHYLQQMCQIQIKCYSQCSNENLEEFGAHIKWLIRLAYQGLPQHFSQKLCLQTTTACTYT